MPSPPSGQRPHRATELAFRRRCAFTWPALLTLLVAVSCAPPTPRVASPAVPAELRSYLLPPSHGYPLALDAATSRRLEEGFLHVLQGQWESAWNIARELEERDPELAPAQVLAGQALLVGRRLGEAYDVAAPALTRYPDYLAAQLLIGRVAEERGALLEAFELYSRAAQASEIAEVRAAELRPRALEISGQRVLDALRRGRPDEAEQSLATLERWAPGEELTHRATVEVARAKGDPRRELRALRQLSGTGERDLLERRGELELQVGDASAGLEIFERLHERYPDDPSLADQVAGAKFRWRLHVLPQEVQDKAVRPELSRADYAVLVYWLVPGVRTAAPQVGRIATDVLEHRHRQEIIRVVNLQLMDLDESVRRFDPDRRLRRVDGLQGLLRVLGRQQPPAACVAGIEGNPAPSRALLCATAARCGLIREAGECLPEAGVSGPEALEWIRRTVTP